MEFFELTNEYYSHWLGIEKEVLKEKGVLFIETPERDKQQIGYSQPFNLYIFITKELMVISYSEGIKRQIEELSTPLINHIAIQDLIRMLEEKFKRPVIREVKFYYEGSAIQTKTFDVIELNKSHYQDYFKFFKAQHPDASVDGWLEEYFDYLCDHQLVFGIYENGLLVCVSDAPDMPYLADKTQEIGINTLSDYRHKGYAQAVSRTCIQSILNQNKCPMWSCLSSNQASANVANKVGFKKLADVLKLTINN